MRSRGELSFFCNTRASPMILMTVFHSVGLGWTTFNTGGSRLLWKINSTMELETASIGVQDTTFEDVNNNIKPYSDKIIYPTSQWENTQSQTRFYHDRYPIRCSPSTIWISTTNLPDSQGACINASLNKKLKRVYDEPKKNILSKREIPVPTHICSRRNHCQRRNVHPGWIPRDRDLATNPMK